MGTNTSVTFEGTHLDFDNVDENRCWKRTQVFEYNGTQVKYEAREPLPLQLGKGLLNVRDQCPELWNKARDLGFLFYQQPAGFEDMLIMKWKFEKQCVDAGRTQRQAAVTTDGTGRLARRPDTSQ